MTTAKGLYKSTVTIPSGQNTSNAADTGGGALCGFYVQSTFTGSTVTFSSASTPGGTYYPVRDDTGALLSVAINTGVPSFYSLRRILPFGSDYIRVVSGSNEGADRNIELVFQKVV